MGFWPFGKKSNRTHDLTDEERAMGQEVRRMNQEKRRLAHEIEVAELKLQLEEVNAQLDEYAGDEGGGLDDFVMNIVKDKLLGGGVTPSPLETNAPVLTLTDGAIEELISKLPPHYLKIARGMSDDTLVELLKSRTQYDEPTCRRIVEVFRAKNI